MPHQNIDQLKEGAQVKQFFLVRQVETRTTKSGKPFLTMVLGDATGVIAAKVWEDSLKRHPGPYTPSAFVGVQGQVESYQGELQLNVKKIYLVDDLRAQGRELPDFDPALLIPVTPHDREQMWQDLQQLATDHLRPPLQGLVLSLLSRYEGAFLECPAARRLHHPYLGGLLEHTWSVARHALQSLAAYPDLNPDLVLAGAILHDLGKVKEFAIPAAPERTRDGELLGHIVLGWEMVREEARFLDFPDSDLLVQLEHIILSHHGSLEFGSPVLPKTREALLVFFLDDLDAKLKMMDQHLQSDSTEGDFTSFHRVLGRGLYKGGEPSSLPPADDPEKNS